MVNLSTYLKESLTKHASYKFNLELFAEYAKFSKTGDDKTQIDINTFQRKMSVVELKHNIVEAVKKHIEEIKFKISKFQERDGAWT